MNKKHFVIQPHPSAGLHWGMQDGIFLAFRVAEALGLSCEAVTATYVIDAISFTDSRVAIAIESEAPIDFKAKREAINSALDHFGWEMSNDALPEAAIAEAFANPNPKAGACATWFGAPERAACPRTKEERHACMPGVALAASLNAKPSTSTEMQMRYIKSETEAA